ncbi:CDP-glucose 4,6-dehydratase [Belliella sp. DSM 111904]|uniref:CDP-glucose 4,6-dehydratase n=1 Tax=Belliella filtrata TaxID=2923435 RepID=A0ABS9UZU8_9BACT|nr:CDP-glucose 4,6-dehydratase [Belliella filtrata]MCH7409679.1 CDP-glucose 4,6-dehydratase [Belliella filtrata]
MEKLEVRKVNPSFWKGKRVFLTGHTGFKGSWLAIWLHQMGAIVKGYALAPNTSPSLFDTANVKNLLYHQIGDIRDLDSLRQSMVEFDPQILIHMAAQPLVRLSYTEPVDTYMTNVMGTVNVLESARSCGNLKSIVSVTTDKCYENKEWVWGYRENEPMGGYDPYSSSKGCAELVTAAYRNSFFNTDHAPALASARAGNVIGGGDWALDRLIPDVVKAFNEKRPVVVRNPLATRPWQHVLEPLSGYLMLAESLFMEGKRFADAWNFGPNDDDCKNVKWILDQMIDIWGDGVSWLLDENPQPHEARFLKLDCSKAKSDLKWEPKWSIGEVLKLINKWNLAFLSNKNMHEKCLEEINIYNN